MVCACEFAHSCPPRTQNASTVYPENCSDRFFPFLRCMNKLCRVKKRAKRAPLPWVVQAVRSSAHHSYIWFFYLAFIYFLWELGFGQPGWLIRGRSDRLEDMMNVEDENEGEFEPCQLSTTPPTPSSSLFLSPSCIFKELRGHSESEWTMTTGRCSPHLSLSHRALPT